MQAARRGVIAGLRTPVATSSAAQRIGGNQRLQNARSYSALISTRQTLKTRELSAFPRTALRSEFSTIGRLNQQETKPEEKKEEQKKPEEEGEKKEEAKEGEKEGEKKEGEKKEEKKKDEEAPPPPPPHGDKSPLAVFMETLQVEFKKSQEWQDSTKQLAGSVTEFTESPAVRAAREGYSKTAEVAGKVGGKVAEGLGHTASAVGKGAQWTWNTPVVKAGRVVVKTAGEGVAKATEPVRETKVYKDVTGNIKEVIDDGASSRYGGFLEKEERRKQRELRESKNAHKRIEKYEEDPESVAPLYPVQIRRH
jgi:import inner membrane translocase subunit TIM44